MRTNETLPISLTPETVTAVTDALITADGRTFFRDPQTIDLFVDEARRELFTAATRARDLGLPPYNFTVHGVRLHMVVKADEPGAVRLYVTIAPPEPEHRDTCPYCNH